jgi:hypothetical protein
MKLQKRKFATPITSVAIWAIPLFSYLIQKSIGIISQGKDWYWFFCISLAFLAWLTLNFKLTNTK